MKHKNFRPMRCLLALALIAVSSLALADKYALSHVRIVNPGGATIDDGLISIDGDKITYSGAYKDPDGGSTVVDCKGLTAYPGFIDAYTRSGLSLPSIPKNPDPPSAVDGPLPEMWHANRRGIYADTDCSQHLSIKSMVDTAHQQGVTTAMLASGRGGFGGTTAVVNTTEADGETLVMPEAFQELSFGSSGGVGYPSSPMGRIALLRQVFYDSKFYTLHPPKEEKDRDPVLAAVAEAATGLVRTLFEADSEREIQRAFDITDEFSLKTTLFGTTDAWQHADDINRRGMGVIVVAELPREPRKTQNDDPVRRLSDPPLAVLEDRWNTWQDEAQAVVKLQKAGVKFAFSSNGSSSDFLANVRKQIEVGLPEDAALRALTVDAATILGVGDKVGTLAPGRLANVTVTDGDFADAKTKVKFVFVAGQKSDVAKEGN